MERSVGYSGNVYVQCRPAFRRPQTNISSIPRQLNQRSSIAPRCNVLAAYGQIIKSFLCCCSTTRHLSYIVPSPGQADWTTPGHYQTCNSPRRDFANLRIDRSDRRIAWHPWSARQRHAVAYRMILRIPIPGRNVFMPVDRRRGSGPGTGRRRGRAVCRWLPRPRNLRVQLRSTLPRSGSARHSPPAASAHPADPSAAGRMNHMQAEMPVVARPKSFGIPAADAPNASSSPAAAPQPAHGSARA
jgi:hypothetical protein